MQGLILAAGMGKRLKDLTKDNTKCMVKVNGITLIDRVLHQLEKLHLSKIVIVVGYEGQKLIHYIESLKVQIPICFIVNPMYDKTNNIYSLFLAKDYLEKEDTLLLESDLIFEDSVLEILMDDPRENLALVDKYESWMDGTCLKLGKDDRIESFISKNQFEFSEIAQYYKTVNIYKLSKAFLTDYYIPFLEAYTKALGNNKYYEEVLRVITMLDNPEIKAKRLNGQLWYEIDDIQDLDIASSVFAKDDYDKLDKIQKRYGGYWRYPKLMDFCCPVNPYFPPKKLIDEMMASFETLITQYPSGLDVNSLLASKNFGVSLDHILVGNGVTELIKTLMDTIDGKVGLIQTAFDEYSRRNQGGTVVFVPQDKNISYTVDELIRFYDKEEISTLILANPDNSSGNYIKKRDMLLLADWCEGRRIHLVVDESFVDYTDDRDASLIEENILRKYRHMCVIKSVSESHGIPGIRLGIFVSSDKNIILKLKKNISIWNINSLAEFYMQIFEKYKEEYIFSLEKLCEVRREFQEKLSEIQGIKVIPSQSNHIMLEIISGLTSREVTKILLSNYNILVKNLSFKIQTGSRQYIRVAIRNKEDNYKLILSLKEVMEGGRVSIKEKKDGR